MPYAFTECGITMLAELLKSNITVTVSIKIVNIFIEMKKIILETGQVYERLTNIKVVTTNKFYDRFIIIDNKELYHCGASLKDLSKKNVL